MRPAWIALGLGAALGCANNSFPVGKSPVAVLTLDLNNDQITDLVSVNNSSNDISVLLGLGDGNFDEALVFPVGESPRAISAGDLNSDGRPDLVVANTDDDFVSVLVNLFGVGDGTFAPAENVNARDEIPLGMFGVALGDLNGDGQSEIVTANQLSNDISVMENLSGANFAPPAPFAVGLRPSAIAIADFDGDGNNDVITADSEDNQVTVLFGNGQNPIAFDNSETFATGDFPSSLLLADLDGDGRAEIITADTNSNTITIVGAPAALEAGPQPKSVAAADFNGDATLDLAAVNFGNDSVSAFAGKGDLSFGEVKELDAENGPVAATAADLNNDGTPELIIANSLSSTVQVLQVRRLR